MSHATKSNYGMLSQVESFFTGNHIKFDKSGEHFYCSYGSIINKVSIEDGQVKAKVASTNEEDSVLQFTLTNENDILVVAYHSGLITKYNLTDETIEREFKSIHTNPISQLAVNSKDTLLATASSDGTIKLWNLQNHYCSHNLKGINGVVTCVLFVEIDDKELLIGSAGDDKIHIYDLGTSQRIAKLSTHCSTITDIKYDASRKRLISVGRDKIAVIWNLDGAAESGTFGTVIRTMPLYESVESMMIIDQSLIGNLLPANNLASTLTFATVGEEGVIKYWDATSGSLILRQNDARLSQDRSPGTHCMQLCTRPCTSQICAVSSERDIFVYELPDLHLKQQLQGHIDEVLSACWFANNEYIAIACNSIDLKIMHTRTSKCQHLKGHTDIILSVKTCPSDSHILISSAKDCTIIVWRFEPSDLRAQILYRGSGHTHAVHSLGVLNDRCVFFSGGEDTTIKKWTVSKHNEIKAGSLPETLTADMTVKAHDDRIDAIAISPNDQLLATGSRDKTAKLFSVDGLRIVATLKGHRRGVYAVQFSPVDQILVTAADVCLRMWNLNDFTCVKTFQGHDSAVLNFNFLSTGLQLISIASDGNMKLWDCKSSECIKTIDAHTGSTWVLALTDDDERLMTAGQDEKIVIWKDTTQEDREEHLANLQSRVMQEQDYMNYVNKKKWRKALRLAIKMENPNKTITVIKEILLEPDGPVELENLLVNLTLDQMNYIIDCCVGWNASAKNSSIAQLVLNIIFRNVDEESLLKMPSFISSVDQLKLLTDKTFNRYERLIQQATFVDFMLSSIRIQ